jgi:MFS family permease
MNESTTFDKSLKRAVLLIIAFASFITPFLSSAINLALPAIEKDLHASAIELGWVISSFILASAMFLLPFGRLADITGRKKILSSGLFLFTLTSLLIVFSGSVTSLIILRILQGISSAMIFGTSLAILTSVFQTGERGKAMGIIITATYLGLSCGPVIGGILTHYFGWRSIFAFLLPFGVVSLILIRQKIKTEWSEARGDRFDWTGSLIYGFSLAGLMYGFSKLPSLSGWIFIILGTILTAIFLMAEKRIANPIFDISLFLHNRVFTFSGLAALINYTATSAIAFFISLYLQYLKGLDSGTAGLIMISQPVAMAVLSPLAGKLSDRKNPGIIASAGMAFSAMGLVLFSFIKASTPGYIIVLLLIIIGVGFGLFSSPNTNAIMSSVGKRHLGVASAVVGTMRMAGQMMSMAIAMMLISLFLGKESITPETYPSLMSAMRTGFIIFAFLSFGGIFASLARNKSKD